MKHSKFDFINDTKFKQFLRKELDKNENRNDQDLGKFEVWFEFVKTCEQIIEHNETDLKTISELMIKMNNKFSVAKATLQPPMSVRPSVSQSVTKTP